MSKYKVENGTVYRCDEPVAELDNGGVNILKGCEKYKRYILEIVESGDAKISMKLNRGKASVKVVFTTKVRKALSLICGVTIPMPNAKSGYRKTGYRNIILKKKNEIMKSPLLSKDEAIMIIEMAK